MVAGTSVWEIDLLAIAVLLGTSVLYLGAGYGILGLATRRARRLGVLVDY